VNSYDINIVNTAPMWFFGIKVAQMLMAGGAEFNQAAKGRKADQFHDGGCGGKEEMKCGWLEKNKFSVGYNKH